MTDTDRTAGYELLHDGALVNFDVIDTDVQPSPGNEETVVRVELQLGELEDDGERSDDHEWGSLGFIFVLATLSFNDARPRGMSEAEFEGEDEFTVAGLFRCLRFEHGTLRFSADYVRGRCMKTDITIRADGRVTLNTQCRGEIATRWLDRLKGKKLVRLAE